VTNATSLRESLQQRLLDAPFDPRDLPVDVLRDELARVLRDVEPLCPVDQAARVLDQLVDDVGGLGPLEQFMADPDVSEIMVNGTSSAYVERKGRIEPVSIQLDDAGLTELVRRVIAPLGLRLDHASPLVDARLPDGSRLHAVLPPIAPDGPHLTIRRFVARAATLASFRLGETGLSLVRRLMRRGDNLLVAGATSAGKTTFCNALAREIPAGERIVTIEETAELQLPQAHVVRLEARPNNAEGVGEVSVRDLVRTALRMRPDRLIVGEVRGAEALDMLQACNTGHDGSISTVHANSPRDALTRLETLALCAGSALPLPAVRTQIGCAIDVVVQVARASDGARRVVAVAEVDDAGTGVRLLATVDGDALSVFAEPQRRARRGDGL